MKSFPVELLSRDFTAPLSKSSLILKPEWYSWNVLGGPDKAEIRITGTENRLWETLQWLRSPVRILDRNNVRVWWGYVHAVNLTIGRVTAGVSLNSMFNRIAVAYSAVDATTLLENRATTSWLQDDVSVSAFGTKELMISLSKGNAAQAAQVQARALAELKNPAPTITIGSGGAGTEGRLECYGWWHTLDWRYYAVSEVNDELLDIGDQIGDLLDNTNAPFLQAVTIEDIPTGVTTNSFRRGDNTVQYEVEELLKTGGSSRRFMAIVDSERNCKVKFEPVGSRESATVFLKKDGSVENRWNDRSQAQACPVGEWAVLKDVIPPTIQVAGATDPTLFFIEGAEYKIDEGSYLPTPRSQSSSWDGFTSLQEG